MLTLLVMPAPYALFAAKGRTASAEAGPADSAIAGIEFLRNERKKR